MRNLTFIIFILLSSITYSQNDNTPKFWDHVRFGGGFGLGFGSNSTTIAISPSAVYEFNDTFPLGIVTTY
jgi:hypothetical protein